MKKLLLFSFVMFLNISSAISQEKSTGILFKADHWGDEKGKGGWAAAMEDLNYEKVEVLLTSKYIKVTLGNKVLKYLILSKKKSTNYYDTYNVKIGNKTFELYISKLINGDTMISIEHVWIIPKVKSVSKVELIE